MRRLRLETGYIPEGGALIEVTYRTIHSRFLLRPHLEVNDIIVGILGRAQQRDFARGSPTGRPLDGRLAGWFDGMLQNLGRPLIQALAGRLGGDERAAMNFWRHAKQ
jgi:hypothetical protein